MESEEELKDFRKPYLLKILIFYIISKAFHTLSLFILPFNPQQKPHEIGKAISTILILQLREWALTAWGQTGFLFYSKIVCLFHIAPSM